VKAEALEECKQCQGEKLHLQRERGERKSQNSLQFFAIAAAI
jgi:hypothetical protein